ncbi:bifunctional diguanylate cyclase/phosphodiesterase [Agrobacterium rosae]|uniref:Diguanylate cyclase n=1 Tax=Agrobacterium rosae TaxID=1972867 RepID=A0AAE5RZQ8_9HYPH|nr:EAL domain-containing protein [Agrobacterium rosae]KAA3509584.1 EAL domain-containing protein [Agrobacterium rosae]KAA3516485.1 EAL domain-containing protein [Agrobacterium rosae]MCM2435000.1 EAL domain-containing protein [Agrobacterium rosae]MQB50284.1 EAL domain-containing protein [Agrobacterium rosae]POO52919.1 diguanylate cyclase [Agrobacterium rosae]
MTLELQNAILEMIARGETLRVTIERLCVEVEALARGTVCSVLSVEDGHLHPLAGPSLPPSYSDALDNMAIGALMGSCGAAAYQAETVTVKDIEHDPRWVNFRHLALPLGFKACWSTPICSGNRVVATFAFYFSECRGPNDLERRIVDACVHLCAIAIERDERERLTYIDILTGLPNLAKFIQVLSEQAEHEEGGWGVILVDLDNLKVVNDTFGHRAGDELIQIAATRIAAVAGKDRAFRVGGDEFAVVVENSVGSPLVMLAAEIIEVMKEHANCASHVLTPGATLGGCLAGPGETPEQVRHCADVALYHAKERSRGTFIEYSAGLGTTLTRRLRAIRDVSLALAENRIHAHYQPIVRLDTGEMVGFEALCRMTATSGEIIAAANFHEATKDAHVAAKLTECMLSCVARDMRAWLDGGLPFQHVGINLSAADFHAGHLRERLCTIFADAGVPLNHVILEVTESVYLSQRDDVVADEIRSLRKLGMRVALDDFGTGFASLTHLLTVPVDIIKIDKSFVDQLVSGNVAVIIVEGLLSIAAKLGLRVVAEGIETDAQLDQLLSFGCRLGQGYLFSKVVDRDAATSLLTRYGQHAEIERSPLRA